MRRDPDGGPEEGKGGDARHVLGTALPEAKAKGGVGEGGKRDYNGDPTVKFVRKLGGYRKKGRRWKTPTKGSVGKGKGKAEGKNKQQTGGRQEGVMGVLSVGRKSGRRDSRGKEIPIQTRRNGTGKGEKKGTMISKGGGGEGREKKKSGGKKGRGGGRCGPKPKESQNCQAPGGPRKGGGRKKGEGKENPKSKMNRK